MFQQKQGGPRRIPAVRRVRADYTPPAPRVNRPKTPKRAKNRTLAGRLAGSRAGAVEPPGPRASRACPGIHSAISGHRRRGAGGVERGGLENRCAFTRTEGSNPSLSAINSESRAFEPTDIVNFRLRGPCPERFVTLDKIGSRARRRSRNSRPATPVAARLPRTRKTRSSRDGPAHERPQEAACAKPTH